MKRHTIVLRSSAVVTIVGVLTLALLAGVLQTSQEKRRIEMIDAYFTQYPHRSEYRDLVVAQTITQGMTTIEVRLAWGDPRRIHTSVGIWGQTEQWVYGSDYAPRYVYFDNGIVSGWQY